jgi:hypothetical protein
MQVSHPLATSRLSLCQEPWTKAEEERAAQLRRDE